MQCSTLVERQRDQNGWAAATPRAAKIMAAKELEGIANLIH